ncbi:MAG: hypothetical protein WCJ49_04590, partial [Deltaproteobacteria bacterium]
LFFSCKPPSLISFCLHPQDAYKMFSNGVVAVLFRHQQIDLEMELNIVCSIVITTALKKILTSLKL